MDCVFGVDSGRRAVRDGGTLQRDESPSVYAVVLANPFLAPPHILQLREAAHGTGRPDTRARGSGQRREGNLDKPSKGLQWKVVRDDGPQASRISARGGRSLGHCTWIRLASGVL